jgi:nitrogen fixation protein NifZ
VGDISRDSDEVELTSPPRFEYGERVISRHTVRNDGTYRGKDIGDVLVTRGEIGYVSSIGTFLQQFYIYAVEFVDSGHRVGMRGRELVSLDRIPPAVLQRLGPRTAELDTLRGGAAKREDEHA